VYRFIHQGNARLLSPKASCAEATQFDGKWTLHQIPGSAKPDRGDAASGFNIPNEIEGN